MKLKHALAELAPESIRAKLLFRSEYEALAAVARIACVGDRLRRQGDFALGTILDSREIAAAWADIEGELDALAIPDGSGGVNPGDRRAIYYLISHFRPASVLEVGSHIGASTVHIAAALHRSRIRAGQPAELTTVDIADVNDPIAQPWLKFGTDLSPREMLNKLDYGRLVEFIQDTSLHFAAHCGRKFDFIFLDGDHSAPTVYREIPAALDLLTDNGVILLHDYFPKLRPLWSNGSVIAGPRLATQRFAKERVNVVALPLGALPWPTKLQSNITSLALLLRTA